MPTVAPSAIEAGAVREDARSNVTPIRHCVRFAVAWRRNATEDASLLECGRPTRRKPNPYLHSGRFDLDEQRLMSRSRLTITSAQSPSLSLECVDRIHPAIG